MLPSFYSIISIYIEVLHPHLNLCKLKDDGPLQKVQTFGQDNN